MTAHLRDGMLRASYDLGQNYGYGYGLGPPGGIPGTGWRGQRGQCPYYPNVGQEEEAQDTINIPKKPVAIAGWLVFGFTVYLVIRAFLSKEKK